MQQQGNAGVPGEMRATQVDRAWMRATQVNRAWMRATQVCRGCRCAVSDEGDSGGLCGHVGDGAMRATGGSTLETSVDKREQRRCGPMSNAGDTTSYLKP